MAGSVNKVILIGRLGADPEVRYTPKSGTPVASFSLATDESYKDPTGQKVENTEWHRVVVLGKLAEFCSKYLSKGRLVYVEGRLQTREWEDKNKVKRWTTEVVARTIQILDSKPKGNGKHEIPEDIPEETPVEDDIPF